MYHDTALLKTVYSHPVITNPDYYYAFSYLSAGDSVGIYAEKIGSLKTSLYPSCWGCPELASMDYVLYPGAVRCYQDNDISVKLVPDYCDKGIIPGTGIKYISDQPSITVSPNPASNNIDICAGKKLSAIRLFTMNGQQIMEHILSVPSTFPTCQQACT